MQSDEEEEIDFKQITNEPVEQPTEATKRAALRAPSAHKDDIDSYHIIKLSNIYFGATSKEKCMMGNNHNDFGLIFRPDSCQVSICIHRFKDEVVIPFDQVPECKLKNPREVVLKLKPNFVRAYYTHPKGLPYIHEPILKNFDPTEGMFSKITNIILKSYNSKSFDILVERDFAKRDEEIETEKYNQTSDSNSPMPSSSPNNKSTPSSFNDNYDNELPEISTDNNSTFISITQTTTRTRTFVREEDTPKHDGELIKSKINTRKERSPSNPLVQSQSPPPSKIQTAFNSTHSQIQPVQFANSDQSSFNSQNFNKSLTPPPQQQSKSAPKTTKILPNIQDSTHEELYITCTFPTERRAILYSIEGSLYHLNYSIRQKFNKQNWKNSWYKYDGEWKPLVDEEDWKAAKFSKKKVKGYIRIEICLR